MWKWSVCACSHVLLLVIVKIHWLERWTMGCGGWRQHHGWNNASLPSHSSSSGLKLIAKSWDTWGWRGEKKEFKLKQCLSDELTLWMKYRMRRERERKEAPHRCQTLYFLFHSWVFNIFSKASDTLGLFHCVKLVYGLSSFLLFQYFKFFWRMQEAFFLSPLNSSAQQPWILIKCSR